MWRDSNADLAGRDERRRCCLRRERARRSQGVLDLKQLDRLRTSIVKKMFLPDQDPLLPSLVLRLPDYFALRDCYSITSLASTSSVGGISMCSNISSAN
jgi:hypothetical protein